MSSRESLQQDIIDAFTLKIKVYNLTCYRHPVYIRKDIFNDFLKIELSERYMNQEILYELKTFSYIGYSTIIIVLNYKCLCRLKETAGEETLRKVLDAFKVNKLHVRYITKLIYLQYQDTHHETNYEKKLHKVHFKRYFQYFQKSNKYRKSDFIKPNLEEYIQNNSYDDDRNSDNSFIELAIKDYELYLKVSQIDNLILMQYTTVGRYKVIDELLATFGRLMKKICMSVKEFLNFIIRNDGLTIKANLGIAQTFTNADLYFYSINSALAIIINNKHFTSHSLKIREGSEKDVEKLCKAYQISKVPHCVLNDLNRDQIIAVIEALRELNFNLFKNVFICIMSHGKENGVIHTNDGQLEVGHITKLYKAITTNYDDVYTFLILAACRGRMDPEWADEEDVKDTPPLNLPRNMTVSFSTREGLLSYRDATEGKPFITFLAESYLSALHNDKFQNVSDSIYKSMNQEFGPEYFGQNEDTSLCKQPIGLNKDIIKNITKFAKKISEKLQCKVISKFPIGISVESDKKSSKDDLNADQIRTKILQLEDTNAILSPSFQCSEFLNNFAPFESWQYLTEFENNLKINPNYDKDLKDFFQYNQDINTYIENALSSLIADYLALQCQWGDDSGYKEIQNLYRVDKLNFINILWEVVKGIFLIDSKKEFNIICKNWIKETKSRILKLAVLKKLQYTPFENEYDLAEVEEVLKQSDNNFKYIKSYILNILTSKSSNEQIENFSLSDHLYYKKIYNTPQCPYNLLIEVIEVLPQSKTEEVSFFRDLKFYDINEFLLFNQSLHINKSFQTWLEQYLNLGIRPSKEPTIFLQGIWLRLFSENILHKLSWLPDEIGHKTSLKFLKITSIIQSIFCKQFENSDNLELFDVICNKYFETSSARKGANKLIQELPLETLQDILEYNEVLNNSSLAVEKLQRFLTIFWNDQGTMETNLNSILSKIFNKKKIFKHLKNSSVKDDLFATFQKLTLTKIIIIYDYVRDLNETSFDIKLKNWFDLNDSSYEKLSNCAIEYFIENTPFVYFEMFAKCDQLFENSSNSYRLKLFFKEFFSQRKQSENCVIEMCQKMFDTQLLNDKNFKYLNSNIILILKMACKEWLNNDDGKEWNHFQQYSEHIDYWFDKARINISSILDNTPLNTFEQLILFNALLRKSNNCYQFIDMFLRKFLNFQTLYSVLTFLFTNKISEKCILFFRGKEVYHIILKIYEPTKTELTLNENLTVLHYFLWSTPYIYYKVEPLFLKERRIQICVDNFMELSADLGHDFKPTIKSFKSKNLDIFKENDILILKDFTILAKKIASNEEDFFNCQYALFPNAKTQNPLASATDNVEYHFDESRLALEEILINNLPLNKANLKKLECYLNSSAHAQTHLKDFIENHLEISLNSLLKLLDQVKVNIFITWLKLFKKELIQDLNWQMDVQNLLLTHILKQVRISLTGDINSNFELFSENFFNNCNYRKAFCFLQSLPFKTLEQIKEVDNDINNNYEFEEYLQEFLDQFRMHKIGSINMLGKIFDPITEKCTWYTDDETQKYCLYTSSFINLWTKTFQGRGRAPPFYKYMNKLRKRLFPEQLKSKANCCELEKIIQQLPLNESLFNILQICIKGSEGTISYWRHFLTKRIVFSTDILKYYDKNEIMIYNFLCQLFNDSFLENFYWKNEFKNLHLKSLSCLDNSSWTETNFDKIVLQSLFEETPQNIALFANTVPFKSLQDLRNFEDRIKKSKKFCNSIQNALKNSKYFKIENGASRHTIYDMFRDIFSLIIDNCVWNCLDTGETNLCCISKLNFTDIVYQSINSEREPTNRKFLSELQENLFIPWVLPSINCEIPTVPKWKFHYELRRHLFKHTPRELVDLDEEFMDLENIIKKLPLDNSTVLESYLQRSSYSMECWIEMLKKKFNSLHHNGNDYKMQIFKLWTMVVSKDFFRQYNCYKEIRESTIWISLYRTLSGDQELFNLYTEYCFLFSNELNFAKYKFIKYLPILNLEQLNYFEQNLTSPWYRNVVKDYIYNILQYYRNTKNKENVEIEYILYKQFEPILQQCGNSDDNLFNIGNCDITKLKFTNLLREEYVKVYKQPDWEFGYSLSKMILTYKPQSVKWCQVKCPELQEIIKQLPLSNKRLISQLEECLNSSANALNYWLFYISRNTQANASNFWQHYTPTQIFDYNAAEKDVYAFWYILLHEIVIEQCNWDNEIKSLTITKTFRFIYGNTAAFNGYSKWWFNEHVWRNIFGFFNFTPVVSFENLIEFNKFIGQSQSEEVKTCFREIFHPETKNEPNDLIIEIAHLLKNIRNKFVWCREDSTIFKEYCSQLLKNYSETNSMSIKTGAYHYTKQFIHYILFEPAWGESNSKTELCSLTLIDLLQQTFAELYEIPKCEFMYTLRRTFFPETPKEIDKYELDNGTIENLIIQLPLESTNKFSEFYFNLLQSKYKYAYFNTFLNWIVKLNTIITNDEYKDFIYRVWHSFLAKDIIIRRDWNNVIENEQLCKILSSLGITEDIKFYTYSRIFIEFYPEKNISMPITSLKQLKEMDKLLNDSTSYRANIEKYFLAIFKLSSKQQTCMLELVSELFKPILSECIWNDSEDPLNCEKYKLSKSSLLYCIQIIFEETYHLSNFDFMYSLHKFDFMYSMHKILFNENLIKFDQFPLKTKEDFWQLENIVKTSEHASRYLLEYFQQLINNNKSNNLYIKFPFWVYLLEEDLIAQFNWNIDIAPLTITEIFEGHLFIGSAQLFDDTLYRKVVCSLKNLPFKSLEHLISFDKEISENYPFKKCMEKYLDFNLMWSPKMSKTSPLFFAAIKDDCVWDYKDQLDTDNMKPCIKTLALTDMLQKICSKPITKWKFLYSFRIAIFDWSPVCTKEFKYHLKQLFEQFPFHTTFELKQFDSLLQTSENALDLWLRYTSAFKPVDINDSKSDFAIYVFNIWHHLFHESLAEKCNWWNDICGLAITETMADRCKHPREFLAFSEFWFANNAFRKSIDYGKTELPSNYTLHHIHSTNEQVS